MALIKSPNSTSKVSTPAANDNTVRRGQQFGNRQAAPSTDTYIKLRFTDELNTPETWFKLNIRSDGVHSFESRDYPIVLMMSKGDSHLRMYNKESIGNFDALGDTRENGLLAKVQVIKRKETTPGTAAPMFLAGTYSEDGGSTERQLRGNMVGSKSQEIMRDLQMASYHEWKSSRQPASTTPAPMLPVEIVAGQELNFGF